MPKIIKEEKFLFYEAVENHFFEFLAKYPF